MSKQTIKKFRKNDYSYDDNEEYGEDSRQKVDKRKVRRVERALRTKDISALVEDDEDNYYEYKNRY